MVTRSVSTSVCVRWWENVLCVCARLHGCVHTWECTCVQSHAAAVDVLCTNVDTGSQASIHTPLWAPGRHAPLGTRCGFAPRPDRGITKPLRNSEGSLSPFPPTSDPSPPQLRLCSGLKMTHKAWSPGPSHCPATSHLRAFVPPLSSSTSALPRAAT